MRKSPSYQGGLDWLCGPYAVVNALTECGLSPPEELFKIACQAPVRRRWPDILWTGTTFGDLRRMIRRCLDSDLNDGEIVARYPFWKRPPATNADYWTRFDAVFEQHAPLCGIVGMTKPWPHWIVVTRHGGRLRFIDADPNNPHPVKNRTSIFAGERRQKPTQWLLDRRELVVFFPRAVAPDWPAE